MIWPDTPNLPQPIRELLERRVAQFLEEAGFSDAEQEQRAVQALCLNLFSIIRGISGSDDEGFRQLNLILLGQEWDTEEPRLAQIQKYLNRLFSDKLQEAHEYIDRALNERAAEDLAVAKDALKAVSSKGGAAKHHAHRVALEQGIQYWNANHDTFTSKKAGAIELAKMFPPVKWGTFYRKLRVPKS